MRRLNRRPVQIKYSRLGVASLLLVGLVVAGAVLANVQAQDRRGEPEVERGWLVSRLDDLREELERIQRMLMGRNSAAPASEPLVRGYVAARVGGPGEQQDAEATAGEQVYLPAMRVTLRNLLSDTESIPVTTDLSGRYTARVPGTGRYRVCWDGPGFGPGCADEVVSIQASYASIGTTLVPVGRTGGTVTMYGHVTLADGSTPRALDPLANVNAFARLSLLDDQGGRLHTTPVNNDDLYVIPAVPLNERLTLLVQTEGYALRQAVIRGNGSVPEQRLDLTILNHPPTLDPVVALDDRDARVAAPSPGQRVRLLARVSDADEDELGYLWRVTGGTISSATDRSPEWDLPTRPGNHAATLTVYDGRGGYARSSVNLKVTGAGLVFSGTVAGTDAPALAGAQVDVNGRVAVTDARGFFRLFVPDRDRFVMSIRRRGYAFSSDIYYAGVTGGRWTLTRAEVVTRDPTQDFEVRHDDRSPEDCAGTPTDRMNWREHPALAVPQFQDGRGRVIPPPLDADAAREGIPRRVIPPLPGLPTTDDAERRRECGPGIRVRIPSDSLVDASGNPPTGDVEIEVSTIDLATPNQMPGNYSVVDQQNQVLVMQSYGAGTVEVFTGGTELNLAPGARAEVVIPVDRVQLESGGEIPPQIPLLTYDEPRGVWREDGVASLQTVDGFPAYVAQVSHFSALNTDLIKSGQACLAVQNEGMPASYDLEVTIPQPDGAAPEQRYFSSVVGGVSEHVVLNLPTETNIVLVPIRTTDANPDLNGLPMGVFVVNTGGPQNTAWPTVSGGFANEPVGPPYYLENGAGDPVGACSSRVELQDLGLDFFDPPTPLVGAFLHGLSAFAAVNLTDTDPAFPADANQALRDAVTQASADYRAQIDPRGLRPTLSCFKVVNRLPLGPGESCPAHDGSGFVPAPALGETVAVYANTIDLGFGREMHCTQDGSDVACYVSNYDSLVYTGPGEGSDVTKAQSAVDGLNGLITPDATVAMEFSRVEDDGVTGSPVTYTDSEQVVKFYVFDGAGLPLDAANLDGLGARPLPQLCMVCHGGQIPNPGGITNTQGIGTLVFASREDVKLDAKFLPFDLASFSYAAPDSDAGNPFNKLNQQDEFQALNEMVRVAPPPDPFEPSSQVIDDLVAAWYPGGATSQVEDAVVPLWDTDDLHRSLYRDTVARACRTCHVANLAPTLRFEQPGQSNGVGFDGNLGAVQLRTCAQHVMPHARRTHDLFWTSTGPSQPAQLQAYGDSLDSFGWQVVGEPFVSEELACGNEYTAGGDPPQSDAFAPVANVFSAHCVGCHNDSNAAAGFVAGLSLEGDAYDNIVEVDSTQLSTMKLVALGASAPDTSYLWHKISDTHLTEGGSGDAMPQGTIGLAKDPSTQADANVILNWIKNGALP